MDRFFFDSARPGPGNCEFPFYYGGGGGGVRINNQIPEDDDCLVEPTACGYGHGGTNGKPGMRGAVAMEVKLLTEFPSEQTIL